MLDYTRGVISDTIESLKRVARFIDIVAQLVYLTYITACIATGRGYLATNCILLAVSIAYLIYFLSTVKCWYTKDEKAKRKRTKIIFKRTKWLVNLAVVILAIVNACTAEEIDIFSILGIVFTSFLLIVSALLDLTTRVLEKRANLFLNALKRDLQAPVEGVKNVVKRITHKAPSDDEIDPVYKRLDKIRSEHRDMRKKKKEWKKSEKILLKQQKKNALQKARS